MITAPLSRILAVQDVRRSLAFYRDVLGFGVSRAIGLRAEGNPVDVVLGPACIRLIEGLDAPDSTGKRRPRGAAMLFLETDALEAWHADILERGGQTSGVERVNWIKYRVFEMRDPDGHVLWFGQSFQEPTDRPAQPMLRRAIPFLPLSHVGAGIVYYRDRLGFRINHAQDDLAILERDDVTLGLILRSGRCDGTGACYVYVRDADALHTALQARGALVGGLPVSQPWGLREFEVRDPEGNRITFGQTFE
jgi:catechol 2,3-dioxygenase-like lactoylglutathione lyase family enzyme